MNLSGHSVPHDKHELFYHHGQYEQKSFHKLSLKVSFPGKMDLKHLVIGFLKWLAFISCAAAFIWKASDSFMSYYSQGIGTKIELRQNYESDLPSFAICRHPSMIFDEFLLKERFNLSSQDLKTGKVYEAAQDLNMSLVQLCEAGLINDSSYIKRVTILEQGKYGGGNAALPNLISDPRKHSSHWRTVYHPLFGICHHFEYQTESKANIEFVKIFINFSTFSKDSKLVTPFLTLDEFEVLDEEDSNIKPKVSIMINVYDKGSFLRSRQLTQISSEEGRSLYTIDEEIIDKSKTSWINKCENQLNYVEDDCLMNCLVSKHLAEFGCLHFRLYLAANETVKNSYEICNLSDLEGKMQKSRNTRKNTTTVVEDYGFVRIKRLLSDFFQDSNLESRCACPTPCARKNIRVSKWPTMMSRMHHYHRHHNYVAFHVSFA